MLTDCFVFESTWTLYFPKFEQKKILTVIVLYKNTCDAVSLITVKLHDNDSFTYDLLMKGLLLSGHFNPTSRLKGYVRFLLLFVQYKQSVHISSESPVRKRN